MVHLWLEWFKEPAKYKNAKKDGVMMSLRRSQEPRSSKESAKYKNTNIIDFTTAQSWSCDTMSKIWRWQDRIKKSVLANSRTLFFESNSMTLS